MSTRDCAAAAGMLDSTAACRGACRNAPETGPPASANHPNRPPAGALATR